MCETLKDSSLCFVLNAIGPDGSKQISSLFSFPQVADIPKTHMMSLFCLYIMFEAIVTMVSFQIIP